MYTTVWNKYLPVIRILLKRSISSEQTLDMNKTDFERASVGRKTGYKFSVGFSRGRTTNVISSSPLAADLAYVLLQDDMVKELFMQNDFNISMNTKFQLTIKHIPQEGNLQKEEPLLATAIADTTPESN